MAMPRAADVVLPILRDALPAAQVVTWKPKITHRDFPLVLVRRVGGIAPNFKLLDRPTVDFSTWSKESLADAEDMSLAIREALWDAWQTQRVVDGKGYISNITEMVGPNSVDSGMDNAWRYQSMYSIRLRPAAS